MLIVTTLSLAAGWLVNMTADTLPERNPFSITWRQPFDALGCVAGRRNDACESTHTRRTLITWGVAMLLGWLAYLRLGASAGAVIVAVYAWYLLAVAVIDLEHRRVLNRMLLAALPAVALVSLVTGAPSPISALAGAAIGFGAFLLVALAKPGGMGMGDVKLAGLIGLATGLGGVMVALPVGIIAGGIAGGFLMLRHRLDRRTTMPYAPYLAAGAWMALYFGPDMWRNLTLMGAI